MAAIVCFSRLNNPLGVFTGKEIRWDYFAKNRGLILLSIFLLFIHAGSFAQQKVTGRIVNDDQEPLSGASIHIKDSNIGTVSQQDGSFSIQAAADDVLEVSFVGFQTRQITLNNQTVLTIILAETVLTLDEIAVLGYTSQKIKELTGSVAVVKPKDLIEFPAGQVEQMLQGRVAGLTVITSGEPGSASNVRLHGIGNFGDVTPLYIIDGIEGNPNSLNPNDIESLQVLKNAGAYSIYGVRGANGVIVITTKKGGRGKLKIDYDFYTGITRPLQKGLALLSPQENADLLWTALKNSGRVQDNGNPTHRYYGNGPNPVLPDYLFAGPHTDTLYEGNPHVDPELYNIDSTAGPIYQIVPFNKEGTNWFKETFKPAMSQNHAISVSGGNDYNRFLVSLSYLDQQGTLINTYLKRVTARVNTAYEFNKLRIGENLQLGHREVPTPGNYSTFGNLIASAFLTDPYLPVYDIMGNWSSYGGPATGPAGNPVAVRELAKNDKNKTWTVFGNVYAEIDILRNFTFRSLFGGNFNFNYSHNYIYGTYAPPSNEGTLSSFTERSGFARSWTWTNTISYTGRFLAHHHIKALAGFEDKSNYTREQGGTSKGYFTDDPDFRFLSNGLPNGRTNYSSAGTAYLHSFISQINYGYQEKYFITVTLRRDGSSVFGPKNRFGWFPALSAAWRITEENFIKGYAKWLTDLKLRASWGKTGYQGNTDPFNQFTLYGGNAGDAYYAIEGKSNAIVQGFKTFRIGNPNTGWQEDIVTSMGIESVFWDGKLTITADWYNKKTNGLLFPVTLPALLGDAYPPNANVGEITNTGVDLLVGSKGHFSEDWHWNTVLTFSHYVNKIDKLNRLSFFTEPGQPLVRNEVGHPVSSFYGYKIIGYFKDAKDVSESPEQNEAAPGRFKYLDANEDGKITDLDRVHFGNPHPDFTLGLNLGMSYKNLDFSTFFYGAFGNELLNELSTKLNTPAYLIGVIPKSKTALYDAWTPENPDAKAPIIEADPNFSNIGTANSYGLEKGTYLRNKTMVLGYTLPQQWVNKIRIERLRLYIQSVNLFTITNYSGLDPELVGSSSAFGVDANGNYPNNQRQWLMGCNLSF